MNHLLGTYACRTPYWWSPRPAGEGKGEQGQQTYQAEMFPWLKRHIQRAAMDSPVFDYVVCMVGSDQKGCPGTLILAQTDARIACLALP